MIEITKERYLEAVEAYKKTTDKQQRAYYKGIIDAFETAHKKELNPIDNRRIIGRAPRYYS